MRGIMGACARRTEKILTIGLLTALVGGLALIMASSADAAGQPSTSASSQDTQGVIAIGQLKETDGGVAIVDLRAGSRDGRTAGNLRFYSPEHGYYNGAVRSFSVENGVIHAAGGGGLFSPEGGRIQVRFDARIPLDGRNVTISVQGAGGYAYALVGDLDPGLVKVGSPRTERTQSDPPRQRARR